MKEENISGACDDDAHILCVIGGCTCDCHITTSKRLTGGIFG